MIHIKRIGKGKPVVFLHGFLETANMWNFFDLENAPFESILIDLPGHGNSTFDNNFNDFIQLAEIIKIELTKIGCFAFDIVGHSLGGYIAIELHKLQKNKGKLILFHSNFWEDSPSKKQNRNRVIEIVKQNKDLFIKEAFPNLFIENYKNHSAVKTCLKEALNINSETIIHFSKLMRDRPSNNKYIAANIHFFHLIQGEEDPILNKDEMNFNCTNIPIYFLKNCGHMSHIENVVQAKDIIFNSLNF